MTTARTWLQRHWRQLRHRCANCGIERRAMGETLCIVCHEGE